MKPIFRALIVVLAMTGTVMGPVSQASAAVTASEDMEKTMKQMKSAMRATMNSDTMADFASNWLKFKTAASRASNMVYDGDASEQTTYSRGMKELNQKMALVDIAVQQNNLAQAKAALAALQPVQKSYHKKLDV